MGIHEIFDAVIVIISFQMALEKGESPSLPDGELRKNIPAASYFPMTSRS
jgi:hypothetical protein